MVRLAAHDLRQQTDPRPQPGAGQRPDRGGAQHAGPVHGAGNGEAGGGAAGKADAASGNGGVSAGGEVMVQSSRKMAPFIAAKLANGGNTNIHQAVLSKDAVTNALRPFMN